MGQVAGDLPVFFRTFFYTVPGHGGDGEVKFQDPLQIRVDSSSDNDHTRRSQVYIVPSIAYSDSGDS